jgi:flagellar L-ring protein precursor FlgH
VKQRHYVPLNIAMLFAMLLAMLFPADAWAQNEGLGASPGSLFAPSGRLADSTRDLRASRIDDVVTIVVAENASAVASGGTNTSRKSSATNSITSLAGVLPAAGALANLANLANAQQIQGTGQTSRNLTLSTTLSARVVEVTPNGTLVVEGTKDIAVNSEKQNIRVRGLVRPEDLTTANTVQSTQIANLQVQITGKGVVNDAIKRPAWLYRVLLGLLPF